jgi:hypothetical protein
MMPAEVVAAAKQEVAEFVSEIARPNRARRIDGGAGGPSMTREVRIDGRENTGL